MSTRRQHNRLDKIEKKTNARDPAPLICCVGPQLESDPPNSFHSEEAARSYFDGRDEDPTLVIFAPVPEDKQK
jgi:hypothetical protein